ncbi:uncharacterized protein [Parasteatoda tepidariorum]|uniref:uncharacterized protein isoform X1 n=1 Tax=Parasteatoda tepidariorum TaxID=114398 RepID=UPI001C72403E|nr:uncharacterized protein LOC107449367 [Parasteatoda tepidariorum]
MQNVGRFSVLALVLITLSKCFAVNITKLTIPDFVKNGTEESVLFDCEYSYDKREDEHLVVKWFFEDDPMPVYQWIPKMKSKIYSEKYRVIKDFELDLDDTYTKGRAFKIENPTTELSGKYRCQVESHTSSDSEEDSMIVYVLPSYVRLNYTINDDTVRFVCEIDEVHPLPDVILYQEAPGPVKNKTVIEDIEETFELEEDGAYNLKVYVDIPERNLSTKNGDGYFHFECEVTIDGINYKKTAGIPFFPSPVAEKHEGKFRHKIFFNEGNFFRDFFFL